MMISRIPTYNVLVVSSSMKAKTMIEQLLKDTSVYYHIKFLSNGVLARNELINNSYNIIIINAPLLDESGEELAIHIAETTISGVITIVKSEQYNEVSDKLMEYGIYTVQRPVSPMIFNQVMRIVFASTNKWLECQKKNRELTIKLEEMRVISKAKCFLIETKKMTENDAHHFIEKKAMNERISKYEAAMEILRS